MSPQIAVRLPAPLLDEIDSLVDAGRFETRADAIRSGIELIVDAERRSRIGRAIVEGYERVPQAEGLDEELGVRTRRRTPMAEPERLEVWWGELPDRTPRPYLVLTRSRAIPVLRRVVVAPITTTVRDIPTEVPLGANEGLPVESVASLDNIETLPKSGLVRRVGASQPLASTRSARRCATQSTADRHPPPRPAELLASRDDVRVRSIGEAGHTTDPRARLVLDAFVVLIALESYPPRQEYGSEGVGPDPSEPGAPATYGGTEVPLSEPQLPMLPECEAVARHIIEGGQAEADPQAVVGVVASEIATLEPSAPEADRQPQPLPRQLLQMHTTDIEGAPRVVGI